MTNEAQIMTQTTSRQGVGTFLVIWAGQLISIVGSGLTNFALGVYVYQNTGSATQLGLVLLAGALPQLLLAPVAGVLVDRWDRRWMMMLSDTGSGLTTVAIWLLLAVGKLEIWHIYLLGAMSSVFGVFQRPAHMAATTVLVPKEHYGRASGLTQLGYAIGQVFSPILAGFLMVVVGVKGVILIDVATYLVAVTTLAVVRIPRPRISEAGKAAKGSVLREASYGWKYLRERPGLMGLLVLFAIANFALGFFSALFTPLMLSFTSEGVMGSVMSVGGVGMLIGSLLMSAWGGPRRKIHGVMTALFLFGIGLSVTGLRADPWLIGAAIFTGFLLLSICNASSQAIWQAKVAPDLQGRVFATRMMMAIFATPLAYLLAGPLADLVFEPLMAPDGALAESLGRLIGVGTGRGIGLIFILMGLLISFAAAVAYLHPRIRLVEEELPDHVVELEGRPRIAVAGKAAGTVGS
jgi:hypothetical protein